MKPLVYYARWQGAKLRLRGRNPTAVWGELVMVDADGSELSQPFHFELETAVIKLQAEDGEQVLHLDEMGVVTTAS